MNLGTETVVSADGARLLRPHFAALGNSEPAAVLVFLEDMSLIAEKAQQLKLAAPGPPERQHRPTRSAIPWVP